MGLYQEWRGESLAPMGKEKGVLRAWSLLGLDLGQIGK